MFVYLCGVMNDLFIVIRNYQYWHININLNGEGKGGWFNPAESYAKFCLEVNERNWQ